MTVVVQTKPSLVLRPKSTQSGNEFGGHPPIVPTLPTVRQGSNEKRAWGWAKLGNGSGSGFRASRVRLLRVARIVVVSAAVCGGQNNAIASGKVDRVVLVTMLVMRFCSAFENTVLWALIRVELGGRSYLVDWLKLSMP